MPYLLGPSPCQVSSFDTTGRHIHSRQLMPANTGRICHNLVYSQESAGRTHLKNNGELVLSPQPSEDPMDPLNWPSWRKFTVLLLMSLYAAIGNFTSGSISSAFPLYATPMAFNPPVSIGKLGHLVAVRAQHEYYCTLFSSSLFSRIRVSVRA